MRENCLFRIGVKALFEFTQEFIKVALSFRLISEWTDLLAFVGLVIPEIILNVDLGLLILSSSFVHLYRYHLLHVILACKLRSVIAKASAPW